MTHLWPAVTLTLLAVISPGPDFAMVTRNALTLTRRAGVWTAAGIACGVVIHVTVALAGLGILLATVPQAMAVLRLAGAGWLAWLGLRMILNAAPMAENAGPAPAVSDRAAWRMGFWTNALNPKTAVFVLSLFSGALGAQAGAGARLGLGAFIVLAHLVWFAALALVLGATTGRAGRLRAGLARARGGIDRVFGAGLIAFGAALIAGGLGA